jgi:hypothetical protein
MDLERQIEEDLNGIGSHHILLKSCLLYMVNPSTDPGESSFIAPIAYPGRIGFMHLQEHFATGSRGIYEISAGKAFRTDLFGNIITFNSKAGHTVIDKIKRRDVRFIRKAVDYWSSRRGVQVYIR